VSSHQGAFSNPGEAWWAGWLDAWSGLPLPRAGIQSFHADYERGYIIGRADHKHYTQSKEQEVTK
jgi:hypothetical protein